MSFWRAQRLVDRWPWEINPQKWSVGRTLSYVREQLAIYDDAIASGRPVPASFSARFEPNARKRTLRSFTLREPMYMEKLMLKHVEELREYERELAEHVHRVRKIMLYRQRAEAISHLESLNIWVSDARQELDAADRSGQTHSQRSRHERREFAALLNRLANG